jgi:hypothetical protein
MGYLLEQQDVISLDEAISDYQFSYDLQELESLTEDIDISTYASFTKTVSYMDELIEWFDINVVNGFHNRLKQVVTGNIFDDSKKLEALIKDYKVQSPASYFVSKIGLSFDYTHFLCNTLPNITTLQISEPRIGCIKNESTGLIEVFPVYLNKDYEYSYLIPVSQFTGEFGPCESLNSLLANATDVVSRIHNVDKKDELKSGIFSKEAIKHGIGWGRLCANFKFGYDFGSLLKELEEVPTKK